MVSLGVLFDRKVRYFAAAIALLLAMILPTLVSAAQITSRSVALSSASANADNVTYQVKFSSVAAAGAFVVDFCSESPLIGSACTTPSGFSASAATSSTVGFTDVSALDANTLVVTGTVGAATPITVDLDGIDNPTNDGTIYARIITYSADVEQADDYLSTDLNGTDNDGVPIDDGGVAIPITDTTSVSGAVMETLQFCSASVAITANCANAGANAPVLRLGQDVGGEVALQPGVISEGNIYTQISTNASSGAVVSLKSGTPCGGLMRVGAAGCDIAAAQSTAVTLNSATFGMKILAGTDPSDNGVVPSGALQIHSGSIYDGTSFLFNYVSGNASGVTSTYGDAILDTNSLPANNKAMTLKFGASANSTTPAGNYANDISLIATGTF